MSGPARWGLQVFRRQVVRDVGMVTTSINAAVRPSGGCRAWSGAPERVRKRPQNFMIFERFTYPDIPDCCPQDTAEALSLKSESRSNRPAVAGARPYRDRAECG